MDVFEAIADPVRRDILRTLRAGSSRVVDLAARYPISRPAVSKHLACLMGAGLVTAQEQGRERHYHLKPDRLSEIQELLDALRPAAPVSTGALDALETEVRRTSRDRRRERHAVTSRSEESA